VIHLKRSRWLAVWGWLAYAAIGPLYTAADDLRRHGLVHLLLVVLAYACICLYGRIEVLIERAKR